MGCHLVESGDVDEDEAVEGEVLLGASRAQPHRTRTLDTDAIQALATYLGKRLSPSLISHHAYIRIFPSTFPTKKKKLHTRNKLFISFSNRKKRQLK